MYPFGYSLGMARKPKHLEPFDVAVVRVLRDAADCAGVSGRKLAELSGLGINRVATILREDGPPATVGEVHRLAAALELPLSAVFADAEAAAATAALEPEAPPEPRPVLPTVVAPILGRRRLSVTAAVRALAAL